MDFQKLINEILNEIKIYKSYRKIIFSNTKNAEFEKIIIKPIQLKNGEAIQIESFKNNKAFHKNIDIRSNSSKRVSLGKARNCLIATSL